MLHLLADTTETPPGRRLHPHSLREDADADRVAAFATCVRGNARATQPLPGSARGGAPGDRARQALSGGLRRLEAALLDLTQRAREVKAVREHRGRSRQRPARSALLCLERDAFRSRQVVRLN